MRHTAGMLWMALAVLIWASWLVLTTSGRATELAVIDLAGFRVLIPALILAPLLWRQRADVARVGPWRCVLLACYGLPFTLSVGYGLIYAPVAHAGALVPGMMPLFAAGLSVAWLGTRLQQRQIVGLALLAGAAALVLSFGRDAGAGASLGHALFLLGSLCWAVFAVTLRPLEISPYLATAIVGGLSTVVILPFWILSGLSHLGSAPTADIAFQAVFQGLFSGLIALYAFGQAIQRLGSAAAGLTALTPAVAAVLAMAFLNQIPSAIDLVALGMVGLGIWLGIDPRPAAPR